MKINTIMKIIGVSVLAAIISFAGCSGESGNTPGQGAESEVKETDKNGAADTSEPVDDKLSKQEDSTESEAGEMPEEAEEEPVDVYNSELADKHVRLRLEGDGKDVFALWGSGRPDYRYGASLIQNEDGSIDAWFASPGDGKKEYDWLTYRHSEDGGKTWGDEKVVLAPTPGTADLQSVCDPDVFYYEGYYYLGYTGTVNKDGLCNNVFLARSQNPDGPYEKWNGKDWGGDPVPIVYFKGVDIAWGVGEPSFVVVDDKIYVYSTLDSFSDKYGWVRATQIHTADLTDPRWPSKLQFEGISVFRNDCTDANDYTYADSDSWDVAYLEDSHKFVALSTNRRFKDDSCLLYYESDDGVNFARVSELNTGVITGCHNSGLMADESGHIGPEDRSLIAYAYSGSGQAKWGVWATRFVPVTIDYTDEMDNSEDGAENLKQKIEIDESLLSDEPIMLVTDKLTYTATLDAPVNISYYLMNSRRQKSGLDADKVRIEKYDTNILELSDNNRLVPVREGITTVGVEYKGLRRDIRVRILPDNYDDSHIRTFYPVCTRYDISVNEPVILKIRPMAVFDDYEIHELSGYEINSNDITFRSSDTSVCTVEKDGQIKPLHEGTCVITVEGEDCRYTVDVYVSN